MLKVATSNLVHVGFLEELSFCIALVHDRKEVKKAILDCLMCANDCVAEKSRKEEKS